MTALPRALVPWERQLAIFPPDMALVLGDIVSRLASVLGTWGEQLAREGAPDGIRGISRRGPYERLLLTEWLLQEELPEEFIRRAVSGEHSFLERAYRRESASRRSFVLFDAGVDQLGAPRVVQLAALIALCRRASLLKATMAWGILQDGTSTLHGAVTEPSVMALLEARCTRRPQASDLERWRAVAGASPSSELWLVGPERLLEEARRQRASLLSLAEILEPREGSSNERVVARVQAPDPGPPRRVILELPPASVATRLLRDPFGVAAATRQITQVRIDPASNILFSVDGRNIHVRGEGGTLLTFQIPNSPRARIRPPSLFSPGDGHQVIAVGQSRSKKRIVVLTRHQRHLLLRVLSKRGLQTGATERYELPPGYDPPWIPHLRPLGILSSACSCYIDSEGALVELAEGRLCVRERASARSSKPLRSGLVYLRASPWPPCVLVVVAAGSSPSELRPSSMDFTGMSEEDGFFFGSPGNDALVAFGRPSGPWTLLRHGRASVIAGSEGRALVGVIERGSSLSKSCLVVLDQARTRLALHDEAGSEILITSAAPIAFAAASDAGRDIAYITRTGELCIYSCICDAMVLRASPPSGA